MSRVGVRVNGCCYNTFGLCCVGLNANMVHAWRRKDRVASVSQDTSPPSPAPQFIALPLPAPAAVALPDIRIELRRGATTVSIIWPGQAAGECGTWLREWLR